ncbi:hypothetical protein FQA39_LY18651 [Lamprigera yunnana]|nr:hypothetical protein FQA39_LY18651 [Lamprigera yunnana]
MHLLSDGRSAVQSGASVAPLPVLHGSGVLGCYWFSATLHCAGCSHAKKQVYEPDQQDFPGPLHRDGAVHVAAAAGPGSAGGGRQPVVAGGRCRGRRAHRCGPARFGANAARHFAQLPHHWPYAVFSGIHPPGNPPVLYRERDRIAALLARPALAGVPARQGRAGQPPVWHLDRRERARLRVDQPFDVAHQAQRPRLSGVDWRHARMCGGSRLSALHPRPYHASIFNISAMSFGALSANAIWRSTKAPRCGPAFAHDTGEGSISKYHREHGGDLIWEIGSGYFGCRNDDGTFNEEKFIANATQPQVKMVELKLSQGAKPGHGGVLPGAKVTPEIAEARGVPVGVDCISPSSHNAFSTPIEMMHFIAKLRTLSGGKPVGFKFCLGHPWEWFGIVKAMMKTGITPDYIVVDGAEGGTGAAPVEFTDHVGVPLQEGPALCRESITSHLASGDPQDDSPAARPCAACYPPPPGGTGRLAASSAQAAEQYPSKPIRIIVPYPAGGGADTIGRLMGTQLSQRWGQPVIVENKPGASGLLGNDAVAKAPGDGYTVLLGITALVQIPSLYKKVPYKLSDLVPLSQTAKSADLVFVPRSSGITSLQAFIDKAKAAPGTLNYGRTAMPHRRTCMASSSR